MKPSAVVPIVEIATRHTTAAKARHTFKLDIDRQGVYS